MRISIALFLALLVSFGIAEVSLSNLQFFWDATYDANKDGVSTL
jgi:hypothetical protein